MTVAPMRDTEAQGADDTGTLTDGIHLVVDALKLNDVHTIYGVVGIPITDLARLAQASGIRYIGFRHESDAGHAAAAAGFLTKKPGICLTVSAPGFLNGLVALANATTNCFPMVQISGSSERHLVDLQRGDYEEMDQLAAARMFAKAAYRVSRAEDIGRGIARAIRTAVSGRPGGVYLDIPAAVLGEVIDAEEAAATLWRVVDPAPRQLPAPEAVDPAIDLLANAKRPLIVLGKGAAYAQADEQIREFVETTGMPYLPMSMAKGLLPDDHPQSAATARSLALKRADVVMLVGARLNWLLGHGDAPQWNPDAKFIQVDIAAAEMDSNQPIAAPLVGDIGSVMEALLERAKPGQITVQTAWREELAAKSAQNVAKMADRLEAARPAPDEVPRRAAGHPRRPAGRTRRSTSSTRAPTRLTSRATSSTCTCRGTASTAAPGASWASAWATRSPPPSRPATRSSRSRATAPSASAAWSSRRSAATTCRSSPSSSTTAASTAATTSTASADPAPTRAVGARHEYMIEAFGGKGYHATTPAEVAARLRGGPRLGQARRSSTASSTPPPAPRAATSPTSTPRASPTHSDAEPSSRPRKTITGKETSHD